MKCPKCKEELFRKTSEFDYVPPVGEWDYLANITNIMANLLSKYPNTNIELSQKEFAMFMATHGMEAISSLLLDKRFEDKKISHFQEQYPYFVLVSFICFVLEWIL